MIDRIALVIDKEEQLEFIKWKCPNRCKCEKDADMKRFQDGRCKNFPEEYIEPCEEIEI